MKDNDVMEMEVFRTGDYGPKGAYSEEDLDRLAADYRPDLLEAPLTFDHAQTGPAYGWVSRLRREGDRLIAVLKGVPAAVSQLVRGGAYKRRSVELFRNLPHTGRPYLRAVSLLGAATPEVKGLRDVCFASRQEACTVEFGAANNGTGDNSASESQESPSNPEADLNHPRQQLRAQATALFSDLRREGFCLGEDDAAAILRVIEGAVGVNPPGNLLEPEAVAAFAEDAIRDAIGNLDALLRNWLLRAPMGEASPAKAMPAASSQTLAFSDQAAAPGRVDPRSLSLHSAAMEIMAGHPESSYRDALIRAAQQR